jgi:hypothetical protein
MAYMINSTKLTPKKKEICWKSVFQNHYLQFLFIIFTACYYQSAITALLSSSNSGSHRTRPTDIAI